MPVGINLKCLYLDYLGPCLALETLHQHFMLFIVHCSFLNSFREVTTLESLLSHM